jgi:CDP-diglyceride synthetase
MTDTPAPKASPLQTVYQSVLGVASGFSLGWFAWVIAGRQLADPPLWPFAAVGILLGVGTARAAGSRPRGRSWVHALWIPVVAFVLAMTAIVIALRSWGA